MALKVSGLNTRNSRYVFGGHTESQGDTLGMWTPVSTEALRTYSEIEWAVLPEYAGRPDKIAYLFFGTPSLGWLVLQHNHIIDELEELVEGAVIRIPDPSHVAASLASLKASDTIRTL